MTLNRITTENVPVAVGASTGVLAINLWNYLLGSQFYSNYSQMYDQMKLMRVKVKVTGFNAVSAVAQGGAVSPSVVTAFDRNGLDYGIMPNGTGGSTTTSQSTSYANVCTYSSANIKSWSTGNAFITSRNIVPSTLAEKSQYVATIQPLISQDQAGTANTQYITNPYSDNSVPFKPIFYIGVDQGVNTPSEVSGGYTYGFKVEFEFTIAFRGMRKSAPNYLTVGSPESTPLTITPTNQDVSDGQLYYDDGPYNPVTVDLSNITTGDSTILVPLTDSITTNGTYTKTPDSGQAYSSINLTVNVPSSTTTTPIFKGVVIDYTSGIVDNFTPFTDFQHADTYIQVSLGQKQQLILYQIAYRLEEGLSYVNFGGAISSTTTGNSVTIDIPIGAYYTILDDNEPGEYTYADGIAWLVMENGYIGGVIRATYSSGTGSMPLYVAGPLQWFNFN